MKRLLLVLGLLAALCTCLSAAPQSVPFRIAIVGLDHGHVDGCLAELLKRRDVQLVGVVESKPALAADYAKRLQVPDALLFSSLESMLDQARPEGVMVFSSTYDHARIVSLCAERKVHVIMEKPLAVSMDQARIMADAAKRSGIHVLVNYETTWYPSHAAAYALLHEAHAVGELRKVVVRDGHKGPREIGCPESFLSWLTDPVLNGGGALMDFGCYGADLCTWLMKGQRPSRVLAVTRQLKPDVYPKVDDDATILLSYPQTEALIQASWNWPIGRKDMDLYGTTGALLIENRDLLQHQTPDGIKHPIAPAPLATSYAEPISYFVAVCRGEVAEHPLSSLETNLIVTEILDAARLSAKTGQAVRLDN